jgi:hypothetical protein
VETVWPAGVEGQRSMTVDSAKSVSGYAGGAVTGWYRTSRVGLLTGAGTGSELSPQPPALAARGRKERRLS